MKVDYEVNKWMSISSIEEIRRWFKFQHVRVLSIE